MYNCNASDLAKWCRLLACDTLQAPALMTHQVPGFLLRHQLGRRLRLPAGTGGEAEPFNSNTSIRVGDLSDHRIGARRPFPGCPWKDRHYLESECLNAGHKAGIAALLLPGTTSTELRSVQRPAPHQL